jgi:hypothetical protein
MELGWNPRWYPHADGPDGLWSWAPHNNSLLTLLMPARRLELLEAQARSLADLPEPERHLKTTDLVLWARSSVGLPDVEADIWRLAGYEKPSSYWQLKLSELMSLSGFVNLLWSHLCPPSGIDTFIKSRVEATLRLGIAAGDLKAFPGADGQCWLDPQQAAEFLLRTREDLLPPGLRAFLEKDDLGRGEAARRKRPARPQTKAHRPTGASEADVWPSLRRWMKIEWWLNPTQRKAEEAARKLNPKPPRWMVRKVYHELRPNLRSGPQGPRTK